MPAVEPSPTDGLHLLYVSEHAWLRAWLRRKIGCAHRAADLAHDTFLRIVASRDALRQMREPRAFLVTTARRLLIDAERRAAVERAYLAELALALAPEATAPSAEEVLIAVQALQEIIAALDGLPARPRAAFLRHYLDDAGHDEIARELGVSARMVRKYLVQALAHCGGAPRPT